MSKTIKRVLWGASALVVLAALAIPKLPAFDGSNDGPPARAAQQGESALRVSAAIITPETLDDKILATGSVLANEQVDLSAETAGKVTDIRFEEGQRVERGQLLVKINDEQLQARLQQAEYRLRLAEDREQRQVTLLEKGGISQEEYDATLNEVNVLRAELDLIRAEINRTEVRAPFDGRVGLRYVSEGAYITPAAQIATLQDVGSVKIEFSIPERYANRVQVGDEITFTVTGVEGTFTGTVYAFEPRVETETRTVRIRARAPNRGGRLLPGLFANIDLVFETIPDALTVPAIAVVPELGGTKVYVLENGRAATRMVQTGIRTADRVQIVAGLSPQDTVLTSGLQQLRPGLPVEIATTTVVTE